MRPSLRVGWAFARVADIADIDIGFAFKSADYAAHGVRLLRGENIEPGALRWVDTRYWPEDDVSRFEHLLVRPGDLILAMDRPVVSAGLKLARATPDDCPCLLVQRVARLRGRKGTNDFLFHSLSSPAFIRHILIGGQTGTQLPHISGKRIEDFELALAPGPEQERIVSALESYSTRLDDAVATLSRVERNLKRYRASVLKSAVEGRLVPTEAALAKQKGRDYEPASVLLERILTERRRRWTESGKKGKYQEPAPPDTTGLPELPEGWCWATLPQLGELNRGKSMHRPRNDPRLLDGPYPFIQTGDVRHTECFIEKYESTYSEFGLAQSRLWPLGTLCITIAANIAETGILKFSACFPDSIVGFLQTDSLLTRYIELFLRTARERLSQYAPATAQKNINLQVLSKVAVPLPPAAEQTRIVNELDRRMSIARHIEGAIDSGSRRAARLRQSILKWAFEGKLADQDPSDEPASVLLERIKAERDIPKSAKKKSRA